MRMSNLFHLQIKKITEMLGCCWQVGKMTRRVELRPPEVNKMGHFVSLKYFCSPPSNVFLRSSLCVVDFAAVCVLLLIELDGDLASV